MAFGSERFLNFSRETRIEIEFLIVCPYTKLDLPEPGLVSATKRSKDLRPELKPLALPCPFGHGSGNVDMSD